MRYLLFSECLQNDFVAPMKVGAPLPNELHIGRAESRKLLGDPDGPWAEEGPLARFLRRSRPSRAGRGSWWTGRALRLRGHEPGGDATAARRPGGARRHHRRHYRTRHGHVLDDVAKLENDLWAAVRRLRELAAELLREAGFQRPVSPRQYWIAQLRYSAHTLGFVESDERQKRLALASTCRLADKLMRFTGVSVGPKSLQDR